jgi:hypothetical protein
MRPNSGWQPLQSLSQTVVVRGFGTKRNQIVQSNQSANGHCPIVCRISCFIDIASTGVQCAMGVPRIDSIVAVIKGFHSRLFCDALNSQPVAPVAQIGNGNPRKLLHKCVLKSFPILVTLSAVSVGLASNAYLGGAPHGRCGKINRDVDGQLIIERPFRLRGGRETLSRPAVLSDGEKQIRQQRAVDAWTTRTGM